MRAVWKIAIVIGAVVAVATPAFAAHLVMPDSTPETYSAYAQQAIQQPWDNQHREPQLSEQPLGEIIAAKLGIAEGSAELFRYHLENAPSTRTQLDGVVDGGGVKLKLTW